MLEVKVERNHERIVKMIEVLEVVSLEIEV